MSNRLAASIAGAGDPGAVLRTGTVASITGTTVTVDIAGSLVPAAAYLDTYRPALGDPVQMLQQGPTNLILGATNALPAQDANSPLTNPSFEAGRAVLTVTGWTAVVDAGTPGTATVAVADTGGIGPKHGLQWLTATHTGTGVTTLAVVSDPVPVLPGQRWAAGSSVTTSTDAAGPAAIGVALTFYLDLTGNYPSDVLATAVQASSAGTTGPVWLSVAPTAGDGTVVPDDVYAMRVALTVAFTAGTVSFDRVICRRIG